MNHLFGTQGTNTLVLLMYSAKSEFAIFFEHWDPGNLKDQECDGEGPGNIKPATRNADRDHA